MQSDRKLITILWNVLSSFFLKTDSVTASETSVNVCCNIRCHKNCLVVPVLTQRNPVHISRNPVPVTSTLILFVHQCRRLHTYPCVLCVAAYLSVRTARNASWKYRLLFRACVYASVAFPTFSRDLRYSLPRGKDGRCVGLTTFPPYCADCLEIPEPQPPGTPRACPGL